MKKNKKLISILAVILTVTVLAGMVLIPMIASAKWVSCTLCGGTGRSICNFCAGAGMKTCMICGGSGGRMESQMTMRMDPVTHMMMPQYNQVWKSCTGCGGSGRSICTSCGGTGRMTCALCGGTGGREDGTRDDRPTPTPTRTSDHQDDHQDDPTPTPTPEPTPAPADDTALEKQKEQIPDAALRTYLKKEFDKDGDNFLSEEERAEVEEIDVNNTPITTMKGIELFPNLGAISCANCGLTELDVSGMPKLWYLRCMDNQLTELDLSHNPEMFGLKCSGNQLKKLDLTKLSKLGYVLCSKNQLTELDLSGNPELYALECTGNRLTTLDVTQLPKLEELVFNDNNVLEIDLSGNPKLKKISAHSNQLLCIDIEAGGADVYNYTFGASLCNRKVDFKNNQFDMATVPGFDMEKAYDWKGGTVNGTVVTLNEGADKVTYMYKCGGFMETEFMLTAKGNELGDTNGDDVVDGRDVVHLMRWLAEEVDEETGERVKINEKNADLNGDGVVDEKDLLKLVKKLGGEKDEEAKK